jgi:hypothetical protein
MIGTTRLRLGFVLFLLEFYFGFRVVGNMANWLHEYSMVVYKMQVDEIGQKGKKELLKSRISQFL